MDSFHECLQEYGEGLEVVQICLEPEEPSLKDEELSVLADISMDDLKNDKSGDKVIITIEDKDNKEDKLNGIVNFKNSKSQESLDDDDDLTITEDVPRDFKRSKSADRNEMNGDKTLSKQHSKDISTSDEMVFAVTPTGLERISYEKYWKECDENKEKNTNDESWKECLNSPTDETPSFHDATPKISVQVENNSLLYIDHEIDGYETCLDDDSTSIKCATKNGHKINGEHEIKELDKQNKIAISNEDNLSAKSIDVHYTNSSKDDVSSFPYVEEHIIKQMKSLRIEPLNVNVYTRKKRKSPTKPSKSERRCIEYYNDEDECLKEINRKKREEEERKKQEKLQGIIDKKLQLKIQNPSEDSTDAEANYVPGCHKCFLESCYAYALKAYMEEAVSCKYCEVIRDMLEPSKFSNRRMSAPGLLHLDSPGSETDIEDFLTVPGERGRRKSTGPLKYLVPSRRPSFNPNMTVTVSPDRREAQRWGPPRRVTLKRGPGAPLGVSIVGGKVDIISGRDDANGNDKGIFGIFIKNVVPGSPAGKCGELRAGDRILEVDGVDVRTAQHERAVQLIKAAGSTVTLTVQSLMTWNTDSSDSSPPKVSARPSMKKKPAPPAPQQTDIKITVTSDSDTPKQNGEIKEEDEKEKDSGEKEKPKTVYSDSEESSDEEDERELQGRTYSEKGVEIDRASAGAIKRSREEKEADPEEEDDFGYTSNKIKKKYGPLGESVVVVKLEKSAKYGLGLSLAGHRDRTRMAVFICGIHPSGSAAKASPPVKVGDEILEVNGIVLHGRCHLNASAIIKGLLGPVYKFILLRRKAALEDVAVKPLTQFPTALEEEPDDRFANYKGVRDITVKKGPSGLGIMIIEGRHTEAGRGIFVSDLQEGSAAEQAGLNIGDMILAVNRESLLSCSYDAAAAKLKQTEGVVVLTVCSPNMKDPDESGASGVSGSQAAAPGAAPKPAPKPEPPADPATAQPRPNQDTVVEINSNNEVLGVLLLGGSDTLLNGPAAVILDIYKNGCIAKDGRLKPGDQIKDCNGITITKEMTHERICLSIKQKAPKLKMTIYRPEPIQYDEIDVELTKKGGKALGLACIQPVQGTGVYLGELLPGSPAEVDGRLQRGDFLASVDGKDMTSADAPTAAMALKLCTNKVPIKVKRFKIKQ